MVVEHYYRYYFMLYLQHNILQACHLPSAHFWSPPLASNQSWRRSYICVDWMLQPQHLAKLQTAWMCFLSSLIIVGCACLPHGKHREPWRQFVAHFGTRGTQNHQECVFILSKWPDSISILMIQAKQVNLYVIDPKLFKPLLPSALIPHPQMY